MPAKKPSTSTKRSQKVSKQSPKAKAANHPQIKTSTIVLIVLACIIGLILAAIGIAKWSDNNEALKAQKTIETYLEDRYDQDFVVEKPKPEGFGFAIEGVFKAVAYPADNPDLKFTATTNSDGSDDKYPGAFWQKQAYDYTKPIVEKVFGYTPSYEVNVITYGSKDNLITGHLPDFTDGLSKYKSQIGLNLKVTSHEQIDASNKTLVAQRTYDLAESIKDLGAAYVHIEYIGASGGGLSYGLGGPNYPEFKPSQPKTIQELEGLVKEGR